jgi:hypothetical protein
MKFAMHTEEFEIKMQKISNARVQDWQAKNIEHVI